MKKPRVGVDVDGVLADFLTPALALATEMLGRPVTAADVKEHDFDFVPKDRATEFWGRIGATGMCRSFQPYPDAVEGMRALREVADVYIVTSRLHSGETWTHEREAWLWEHFQIPGSKCVHTRAKYVFFGDMLIDDKPRNVEEWATEHPRGVPVLWLQPYNERHVFSPAVGSRVLRTHSWDVAIYGIRGPEQR